MASDTVSAMPVVAGDVIEFAGRRLAAASRQPARVLLFGSHARGDAGAHSDLDFLVIRIRSQPRRPIARNCLPSSRHATGVRR